MEPTKKRFRLQYSKDRILRFIGHLDLLRVWERTFRRARLPLAYTQGFHPRARINLGAALPLGYTSACELVEFWLEADVQSGEIFGKIENHVPDGLRIQLLTEISLNHPSLQKIIRSAEYEVQVRPSLSMDKLTKKVNQLAASDTIPMTRRNKPYDLRPLIETIGIIEVDEEPTVRLQLMVREGATGRPDEVVRAIGEDPLKAQIHRRRLLLEE
jgi:radical SAM-linked protein